MTTSDLPARLLARAERLYRDLRLSTVTDWKRETGGLAIGYLPVYVPREMLHAMGVLPVGVHGRGRRPRDHPRRRVLPVHTSHLPRSTIEMVSTVSMEILQLYRFSQYTRKAP